MLRVKVSISADAALRLGKANSGEGIINLDDALIAQLTQEERECLADKKVSACDHDFRIYAGFAEATFEELKKYLARDIASVKEYKQREAQRQQDYEKGKVDEVRCWLRREGNYFQEHADFAVQYPDVLRIVAAYDPVLADAVAVEGRARAEAFERAKLEREAREQEEREVKEQAEAKREAAKVAFIDKWVANQADEELKQQHAAGMLCRKEAVSLIAASVLDPLGESVPRCNEEEHECTESVKYVDCIPRRLWPAWKKISQALKGVSEDATVQFVRFTPCAVDYAPVDFFAVEVHVPLGPFRFKRLIALEYNS